MYLWLNYSQPGWECGFSRGKGREENCEQLWKRGGCSDNGRASTFSKRNRHITLEADKDILNVEAENEISNGEINSNGSGASLLDFE